MKFHFEKGKKPNLVDRIKGRFKNHFLPKLKNELNRIFTKQVLGISIAIIIIFVMIIKALSLISFKG